MYNLFVPKVGDKINVFKGFWSSFNTVGDLIKEGTTEKL
tara:strand:+ start:88 stop:204 length:117 start_codon:yes stop_codon:yes gene_type:complete